MVDRNIKPVGGVDKRMYDKLGPHIVYRAEGQYLVAKTKDIRALIKQGVLDG